ncbi:MAG: DUF58 domain-containing protein [Tessaracoccus sp.]|uniref:DUF58 domain-containing protein n=1 Tax=Tessaracoccus sp. TaxID=1971211 RepID=UPI001EC18E01|nr:DUF58 domain-containing protein [Tessaracoccus sp.]MBK7820090.1 DUF58 domain-containing protein [Tessaracoccus sp.]
MTFLPTHALLRSALLGGGLGLFAVVLGRPGLLMLAAPFVVHVIWALVSRPSTAPGSDVRPRAVAVAEGETVDVAVELRGAPRGALAATQWPQVPSSAFTPAAGTVLDGASGRVVTGFEPTRWGRYTLGPGVVSCTDASLGWRATAATPTVTVTVRPASTTLEGGSGVAHPIGLAGAHRSRHRGDGSDLADVREFRPGDRLRRINWRVTSRLGQLHVNSTLTERDTDVLIVVDTLQDIAPPDESAPTSLDATVRAVAAISRHYARFGDRVAVHDLGLRIGLIRPGAGPRQTRMILGVLSRARRTLNDWVRIRPVRRVAGGTLVFFCSPLMDPAAQDELVRLRRLGAEVIAVDTLPEGVGQLSDIPAFPRDSSLGEAWVLRRMERDGVLDRLRAHGIPVTAWRGTGSLATVLLAMEAARSAPRRSLP